jgi:hypothetical protein
LRPNETRSALQRTKKHCFRNTGIHVKSGLCKVKDEFHCIIDKHLKLNLKIEALAECLGQMPLESIYIIPFVRDYLDRFKPRTEEKGVAGKNL